MPEDAPVTTAVESGCGEGRLMRGTVGAPRCGCYGVGAEMSKYVDFSPNVERNWSPVIVLSGCPGSPCRMTVTARPPQSAVVPGFSRAVISTEARPGPYSACRVATLI